MNPRHKGAVKDRDLERYFPVRLSIVVGMGLPAHEWSVTYSAMRDWLATTVGEARDLPAISLSHLSQIRRHDDTVSALAALNNF
jgi:hypothetical protein